MNRCRHRTRPEGRDKDPEPVPSGDLPPDAAAEVIRRLISHLSRERSGDSRFESILKALKENRVKVVLKPARGCDEPAETGFLSELVNINCTPMGVEMETVPTGAAGLAEDWRRVGGYLRRAMDSIESEIGMATPMPARGESEKQHPGEDGVPQTTPLTPDGKESSAGSRPASSANGGLEESVELPPGAPGEKAIEINYETLLPLSSELKRYEEVLPGAAGRILSMVEKEKERLRKRNGRAFLLKLARITAAWLFSMGTLALAALSLHFGLAWAAIPLGLAGLMAVFARETAGVFQSS